jgi:DNA polymerase
MSLPPLSDAEQELWVLDAKINDRGFYTDGPLLEAASHIAAEAGQAMQDELARITNGALTSTNQVEAMQVWLAEHGCEVKNLQKWTLTQALRRKGLDPVVRRVLELRRGAAHAAAAKTDTLLDWRSPDGRVRNTLQFHGAGPGRWTGRGPQPQNFKRDGEDIDAKCAAIATGDLAHVAKLYPQPLEVVGDIARAMICAAPGHRLMIGDFSGIESRGTAWISGQQSKLDQWATFDRTGDPKDEPYYQIGRRFSLSEAMARDKGKVADLAFGYKGGIGAWNKLAPEDDTSSEEDKRRYMQIWRSMHPRTVQFWNDIDRATIEAVRQPGRVISSKRLSVVCQGNFLRVTLPSGRRLSYPFPRLGKGKYGNPVVIFKDSVAGKFTDCRFGQGAWPGLWTENIVQGLCRDVLAAAMQRLEAAGYPIVLHVHDEIVCEVPDGFGSLEAFKRILIEAPDWAADLPIGAKVREGPRFSKPSEPRSAPVVVNSQNSAESDPSVTPGLAGAEPSPAVPVVTDALEELLGRPEQEYLGNPGADGLQAVVAADSEPPGNVVAGPESHDQEGSHAGEEAIDIDGDDGGEVDDGQADSDEAAKEACVVNVLCARGFDGAESVESVESAGQLGSSQAAPDAAPPILTLEQIRAILDRKPEAPAQGNGHDPLAGKQFNGAHADYNDRTSEQHTGEPYGPIRAALVAKGYHLARSFPFTVPGESEPLFFEDRYELHPSIAPSKGRERKTSRFRHLRDGKELCDTGPRRIIYNWPAIMQAGPGAEVLITEGANKSEPLNQAGLLATAAPYHQWGPECVSALAGRHLTYLEDHDHPDDKGHVKAKQFTADARAKLAPGAASFRIVPALHLWRNLQRGGEPPHGWDVKDWIEAGGDPARLPELCQEILAEGNKSQDPLFWHGEPDPRPQRKWRIKHLMPAVGAGLLSGQWGTYKTFMAIELATTVIAAGQFCDRQVIEPCGVLILATEGVYDLRDRVNVAVGAKHPEMDCAPITWRESCPTLLADGAAEALIKIIQEATEGCLARFKMPIGLVIIDVLTDAAGYAKAGDENDPAIGAKLMGALRRAAEVCRCFVLAVDHFGKSVEAGTRGTSAKEGAADVVLACLGEREVSGTVANTRLALRKVRSGPQGQEFPFRPRLAPIPERSEADGPETTCVISWEVASAAGTADDPWEADRRADTKIAMRALRRAMMKLLVDHGTELAPESGFPAARVINEALVREEFYASTVAEGTAEQKLESKRKQFRRVRDRAEQQGLIGRREIDGQAYLWLLA